MSEHHHGTTEATTAKGRFEPKEAVQLAPPKSDPISPEYLAKCTGDTEGVPTYVAIKGTVFDVSGSAAYAAGGKYHVFTGKDASRALGKMSLEEKDCVAEWEDLDDKEKKVLDDWFTFFSKRYSIVGVVERESSNL